MKTVFFGYPYADNPQKRKAENKCMLRNLHDVYPDVIFISPLMLFDYLEDDSNREAIMTMCKKLIDISDEYWYVYTSPGVEEEMLYAKQTGKPVIRK